MLNNIVLAVLRGIMAFVLLMVVARIIGRKTISQMTFFDFAVSISLGTLAAGIGRGSDNSPHSAIAVMLTFTLLAILNEFLYIKSLKFAKLTNSEPLTLIKNGEIVKENMRRERINIPSLTTLLREKNIFNIADVEFAIMETDGKLSVLPKSQKQPLTPADMGIAVPYKGLTKDVIIDGNIMYENLHSDGKNEDWLKEQLNRRGVSDAKEVFFAALDSSGNLYVSRGLEGREKHGGYGIE